jgi:hypothetical protein
MPSKNTLIGFGALFAGLALCTFTLHIQGQHTQLDHLAKLRSWARSTLGMGRHDAESIPSTKVRISPRQAQRLLEGEEVFRVGDAQPTQLSSLQLDSPFIEDAPQKDLETGDSISDPNSIIGVRQTYEHEERGLRFATYLIAPCSSVCGVEQACAQVCQELIKEWEGPLIGSKLVLEAWSSDTETLLGRVALNTVASTELVWWSKTHMKLAVTQRDALHCCTRLMVFSIQDQVLVRTASLNLGAYQPHQEVRGESIFQFRDLNDDGHIELLAPDPRFALIRPHPIYAPMVYRLTDKGLIPAPEFLRARIPELTELRSWIAEWEERHVSLERLFSEMLSYCFKGHCETADQIVHLAFPQNEDIQEYWEQLKVYLERPMFVQHPSATRSKHKK